MNGVLRTDRGGGCIDSVCVCGHENTQSSVRQEVAKEERMLEDVTVGAAGH